MRSERQSFIERQTLRILADCGSYPLPERALRDHLALRVVPPVRAAEIDGCLRYLEGERRIIAVEGESGLLWGLTDTGRLWWEQHGI